MAELSEIRALKKELVPKNHLFYPGDDVSKNRSEFFRIWEQTAAEAISARLLPFIREYVEESTHQDCETAEVSADDFIRYVYFAYGDGDPLSKLEET